MRSVHVTYGECTDDPRSPHYIAKPNQKALDDAYEMASGMYDLKLELISLYETLTSAQETASSRCNQELIAELLKKGYIGGHETAQKLKAIQVFFQQANAYLSAFLVVNENLNQMMEQYKDPDIHGI